MLIYHSIRNSNFGYYDYFGYCDYYFGYFGNYVELMVIFDIKKNTLLIYFHISFSH